MQPGKNRLLLFLDSWIINTIAVFLTVHVLRGHLNYGDKQLPGLELLRNLLVVSFLAAILNDLVAKPLRKIAQPLVLLTLGLFMLVINALQLSLLTLVLPFFQITNDGTHFSFLYAFLGALSISIITVILKVLMAVNALAGKIRFMVRRQPQPPGRTNGRGGNGGGGNGPVIDV